MINWLYISQNIYKIFTTQAVAIKSHLLWLLKKLNFEFIILLIISQEIKLIKTTNILYANINIPHTIIEWNEFPKEVSYP